MDVNRSIEVQGLSISNGRDTIVHCPTNMQGVVVKLIPLAS